MSRMTVAGVAAILALGSLAWADSLTDASTTDFYSADRAYRLRVEPTRAPGIRVTLGRRNSGGVYTNQWSSAAFKARMFPTAGFVTDDGRYSVLVCGYVHRLATRSVVLGVFGPNGRLIKAYRLADLFHPEEIPDFRRSPIDAGPKLVQTAAGILWVGQASLLSRPPAIRIVTPNPCGAPAPGTRLLPEPLVVTILMSLPTGVERRE